MEHGTQLDLSGGAEMAGPDVASRARPLQPRHLVVLVLVVAGALWAAIRGLHFYGLNLVYDLDQPPLLLVLVGGWLWHRSRRR